MYWSKSNYVALKLITFLFEEKLNEILLFRAPKTCFSFQHPVMLRDIRILFLNYIYIYIFFAL